jgi:hypothetical protein
MTPQQFRKLALETPGAEESSHMSHPDFRIGGKVFATLSQDGDFGVLKLTPDQQQSWRDAHPSVFVPANGAWGERGYTKVLLLKAKTPVLRAAMRQASANVAGSKGARPGKRTSASDH